MLSCLGSFQDLLKEIDAPQYSYEDEVAVASWIDELGRLRIWAGNVGAHQNGPSSLNFRLRDASHIRDEVTKLLTDLERLLDEAQEYISAEVHENDTLSTSDSLDEDPVTELQALFGELATIIRFLYKLAMLIRNPAQHDFLAESFRTDTVAFEPFDQQHVRNKFPQADEKLVLRLAKALTRRRGYLKYRARHSMKLAKGLEDVQISGGGIAASVSETMASMLQPQPVDYNENSSESGISRTSFANSILEGGTISVPAPPKDSLAGTPFPCPYCHFIINAATTQSWHRHVFTDLRPYTCIFQPCHTPDKLYSSRRDWFGHVYGTHDTTGLLCPLCRVALGTVKQYERHVARHLEELALFVLPRDGDNDSEEEEEGRGSDSPAFSISDTEAHSPLGGIDNWFYGHHNATHVLPTQQHDENWDFHPPRLNRAESNTHDILVLRHRNTIYPLHFPAYAIADGDLTVGDVRRLAARETEIKDPYCVKLLYKGKILRDDARSCNDEGMKQNSEILCVDNEAAAHPQSSISASEEEIIENGIAGPRVDVDGTLRDDRRPNRSRRKGHRGGGRKKKASSNTNPGKAK